MALITRQPSSGISGAGVFRYLRLILALCLLITSAEGISQQVRITGGAYFKTKGANVVINGTLVNEGDALCTGTGTISLTGNLQNDGTFDAGESTVTLRGSSAQTISGTGAISFANVTLNNSLGVVIDRDVSVSGTLTFSAGKITTGNQTMTMGISAQVTGSGSGKYIYGNAAWTLPGSGSSSRVYPIGDAAQYTPLILDFNVLSAGGTVSAKTTGGSHPDGLNSGISGAKRVNRYWTISNSGCSFEDFDATFSFVASDVLGGANYDAFIVKRYSGSAWEGTTLETRTSTSTKISGQTGFGDFVDGEPGVGCVSSTPPLSATAGQTTICNGENTTLTLNGGGQGTYETVEWYTGSCGGIHVGSGNGLSVSPIETTTYYGRYENGAPCTYSTSCQSVTITVLAAPTAVITPGGATAFCTGETVELTASGGNEYFWSTGTTTASVNASTNGTYSVTVTSTNGCTDTESQMITVYPVSSGGSIAGAGRVCQGENYTLLTLSGHSGSVVKWQWTTDGTNWNDIASTSTSYEAVDIIIATTYRAEVKSGTCPETMSGTAEITVSVAGEWLGAVSSDWNDDRNWCGGVPGPGTDIIIPAGVPHMPVIGLGNASCRDIEITNGATLTATGTNLLSIYGDWSGTGTFSAGSSTVSYSGSGSQDVAVLTYYNLNFRDAGTKTFGAGATHILKNFTVSENAVADAVTHSTTIELNGGSSQSLAAINYYNLTLGNAGVKTFNAGVTAIAGTFSISGTASAFAAVYNGTVEYNGTATQQVSAITYNHLTFSNSGTKTLPATSFNVEGNWTNNGTLSGGSETVMFDGNGVQTIGGSNETTFNNLEINNSYGITLAANITVHGVLTLTSGIISLGPWTLTMESSSSLMGGSGSSYIATTGSGTLLQQVTNNATDKLFPVGTAASYLPLRLKLTVGSTSDLFNVRVISGLYSTYGINNEPTGIQITGNAVMATWFIGEVVTGGSDATVTLQWNLEDEAISFNRSQCQVGHYTSDAWGYSSLSAASGANPYTRSITGITSLSPFGVFGAQNILCNVGTASLCRGGPVTVTYAATGATWNTGNIFTAQLSSITGSFASPVNIGSVASQTSGTINATIPTGATAGAGYLIRVISSSPSMVGGNNGNILTIDPTTVAGTVSSAQSICGGMTPANLTLSGYTGEILQWQKASDISFTTPEDINETTSTLTGATIGPLTSSTYFRAVVQSGSCNTGYTVPVLITVTSYVGNWLGTTSTDWNTGSNWCGSVIPNSATDVVIPVGVTYMPLVGTAGGICRNLTIEAGASLTMATSSTLYVNGNIDNSGTITMNEGTSTSSTWLVMGGNLTNQSGATINSTGLYSRFIFSSSSAQTFTNNGTVTAPMTSFDVANSHVSGLTLAGSNQIVATRANLFYGTVYNSEQLTLGNGGTTSVVIQRGMISNTLEAGSFDESPVFNAGSGGISLLYDNGSATYQTGYEVPSSTYTVNSFILYDAADVTLGSGLTVTSTLQFAGGTGTQILRIGSQTLTISGSLVYSSSSELFGGTNSRLILSSALSIREVTNGLKHLTIGDNTTLDGAVTVYDTLKLLSGQLTNQSYLTMANGSTIWRSGGSVASPPQFSGTVDLCYSGESVIQTGYEVPSDSTTLNNLVTHAGGLVQAGVSGSTVTLLNDTFGDLANWTGDLGNSYNQFSSVVSANAGGAANEARYLWGSLSGTNYTASIYRPVNTTGYSSLNIQWKQFIDNYNADVDPYTIKVQCADSPGGPWTDIYSLSPTGSSNIGPETKAFNNWTTNVGGTFYIRFYITGNTYGLDYWFFDNLLIEAPTAAVASGVTVNGEFNVTSGTYTIGSNTLALKGSRTGNNAIVGSSSSNLIVAGAGSNLTLPPIHNGLNNLTINRSNGVTSSSDITVNGTLYLQSANPNATTGAVNMDGDTLLMGSSSSTEGAGDVTGVIKRKSLQPNILYTFGNHFTTVKFENVGTLPDSLYMKVSIGTAPSWKTGAIQRIFEYVQKGGSGSLAAIASHYLDSELNGNDEDHLVFWTGPIPAVTEHGRSNYNATENWVVLQNVSIGDWPTQFDQMYGTLGNTGLTHLTWNGSVSTVWDNEVNWTPNGTPSSITDIVIPDASATDNDPTVPAAAYLKTLNILSGAIINTTSGCILSVYGGQSAWNNEGGSFNAGTSQVVFKNVEATVAGETQFHDLLIETDKILHLEYGSYTKINGSLTNNGSLFADNEEVTVEYNGADQTVVNPNHPPYGYHDLVLSGSGTKTMPESTLIIHNNLTFSGSASATAGAAINIGGALTLGSTATFNASGYTHQVGGNWVNNGGTFSAGSGTVTLNGTITQTVGGTSSTTFNNLTINNSSGITLDRNQNLGGILTFSSGKITTQSYQLTLGTDATVSGAGTGKYIYGKLAWAIPAGSPSRAYPVGDADTYIPVSLSFTSVTTPGAVTCQTTPSDHSQIAGSGINDLQTVNRTWSITNSAAEFSSYSATLGFVTDDIDPGADPADFIMKKWNGSSWDEVTVGSRSATSAEVTGLTDFGDFQYGDACTYAADPTSAGATSTEICEGTEVNLTLTGGGGGSNELLQWYSGSCGQTPVGIGNELQVSPTATTTYYGRYENGSSCNYQSACQSVTITVRKKSADPVSATASVPVLCEGDSTVLTLNGGGNGDLQTVTWYTGDCGTLQAGTGNSFKVSPPSTTVYYGRYENSGVCAYQTTCETIEVTVNQVPVVSWVNSLDGQCITATNYPLSGGSPPGGSYGGPGVTGAIFNASLAGTGEHPLWYTYTSQEGCGATDTNIIHVYPRHKVTGYFRYYNTALTAMTSQVQVGLFETGTGTQLGQNYELNGNSGYYEFNDLCPGSYEIRATSDLPTEGSINTTDAAQVNYWGPNSYMIERVRFFAGDVTGENFLNSTDALRIQNHFVYGTGFNRPDWTFWRAGETISSNTNPPEGYPVITVPQTEDLQADFYGLCTGDFNRSFTPYQLKSIQDHIVFTDGKKICGRPGDTVLLSIRPLEALKTGAISMILDVPDNITEVVNIDINAPTGQLNWKVIGGKLRIGWSTRQPVVIPDTGTLLTLAILLKAPLPDGVCLRITPDTDPRNEIADDNFEPQRDVVFAADYIGPDCLGVTEYPASGGITFINFPNPFQETTTFFFTLPGKGNVEVTVQDLWGKVVCLLKSAALPPGQNHIRFDGTSLTPGIYFATLHYSTSNLLQEQTIRIIKTQ